MHRVRHQCPAGVAVYAEEQELDQVPHLENRRLGDLRVLHHGHDCLEYTASDDEGKSRCQ